MLVVGFVVGDCCSRLFGVESVTVDVFVWRIILVLFLPSRESEMLFLGTFFRF